MIKGHYNEEAIRKKQPTVSNPLEHVVSSELRNAIREISTIVRSNSLSGKMSVCDDELFRLVRLCGIAKRLTR